MILGPKCTCVIRTCGTAEAALEIAPENHPILYAEGIGSATHMKHPGVTCRRAQIEASRGVVSGQADLDLRKKTLRDQYVGQRPGQ
jgi:hypothetical protein